MKALRCDTAFKINLLCNILFIINLHSLTNRITYLLTKYQLRSSISVCLWPSFLLFPRSYSLTWVLLLCLHMFFGFPRLRFPSGVQCSAVLVMEFWSLLITCPIHCLLLKIIAILCWLHCLSRSSLEILLGQKLRRIPLKLLVWKNWQFVWVIFCHPPTFWSI